METSSYSNLMFNILFDGDSITACYDVLTNEDTLNGFPLIIKNSINCNYKNVAVSGSTSTDLLNRLKNNILDNFIPDIYIIQTGANDAWNKIKYNIEVTNEQYYTNLVNIINFIKQLNPNVVIIIQTIVTTNKSLLLKEIKDKNDIIKKIAIQLECSLIDNFSLFSNEDIYDDEVHYKESFHERIADEIKICLKEKCLCV